MITWFLRLVRVRRTESSRTAETIDAIQTAHRVHNEINNRINDRRREVDDIRTEQTEIRRTLRLDNPPPLRHRYEDLPGTLGRKV